MTIQLDESFLAMWFVESVPGYQNVICGLNRTAEPNKFLMQYRWRYTKPDKPDEKRWYGGEVTGSYDEVLAKCRGVWSALAETSGAAARGQFFELIRGPQSVDDCARALALAPFSRSYHAKDGTPVDREFFK